MKQEHLKQEDINLHNGLALDNPRLLAPDISFGKRFLFYYAVLLLGLSGAYGCFYASFSIPVYIWTVIPSIALLPGVFTALFLLKTRRVLLLTLPAAGLIALLLRMRGLLAALTDNVIRGFSHTANAVMLAYDQRFGLGLPLLPVESVPASGIAASGTVFAVLVLALVSLLMAWFLIRRKNAFLCFLPTVPFIVSPLAIDIVPHYAAVTIFLVFWAFLLLSGPSLRGKAKSSRKGREKGRESRVCGVFCDGGRTAANPVFLILIPILAGCLMLVGILFPMKSYRRSGLVEDLRVGLTNGPDIFSPFKAGGVAGNTVRVDLRAVGNIAYAGTTAIRVRSSKKEADYLKGFVGSVYTGQSWEALPKEDYRELNEILGGRKAQNLPHLFSDLFHLYLFDRDNYEYDLTVQNVNVNPRCVFAPYGLISGPEDMPGIEFVNDGFLKSGNSIFGTKEYGMKATDLWTVQEYVEYYYGLEGILREKGFFNQNSRRQEESRSFGDTRQMEEWTMPEQMLGALFPLVGDAREYTRFVYSHYTRLPEELKDRLDGYRQEHDLDAEHYEWPYAIVDAIVKQVHSENAYTLSPGVTPAGQDFVEYFLLENHRGYCVHFASAVVALLRSAGIPARYAEGYVVSPSDFSSRDGWADIPDSRAHAWAEIYLSGVGWLPVEATPGIRDGIVDPEAAAAESADIPGTQTETADEPTASPDSPEPAEETSESDDVRETSPGTEAPDEEDGGGAAPEGTGNPFMDMLLFRILPALAAIGLLWAALLINRKLRAASRKKRFMQKDRNKAALAVYNYILRLFRYVGSAPSSPSRPSAPDAPKGIPKDLYELFLKARFSGHMLTKQELRMLTDFAGELADQAGSKAPFLRRFAGKYIYGLF